MSMLNNFSDGTSQPRHTCGSRASLSVSVRHLGSLPKKNSVSRDALYVFCPLLFVAAILTVALLFSAKFAPAEPFSTTPWDTIIS